MLIQALCEYYDVLVSQGKVLPEGYSSVGISYLISLTPEGEMDGIIDCRNTQTYDVKGKPKQRKTPKSVVMPKRTEKPGIDGNVVEHRPLYIFGLNHDSKTNTLSSDDATSKARRSHAAFVEKNREFLADIDSPVCAAVRGFLEKWAPEAETENPLLLSLGKEFSASTYFDFCLSGHPEITLHDCPDVRNKWDRLYARRAEGEETTVAQCGILGKRLPIARIHAKIKGVPGGNPTGNTLVSFNNSAEYSYGKEQSYNSNISVSAMEKYTQALNYLLSDRKHKSTIDDVTVLHWAASNDESCD
ncbi:MAG: type I-C CRISPR-associated protein Cas8c/Csd1, partial [Oscillospiraceae bacterium]|nr:type I-C CRISPR-associated protein Cas8c/Csd1 [Oscillospiraceae bacterium]